MSIIEFDARSVASTKALGAAIAGLVRPGDVILLIGDLGAGKTTLVDGLASALGARAATSPTFALCHLYASDPPLAHVDCWRLVDDAEFSDLALEEHLDDGGVAIFEWGALAKRRFGQEALIVELEAKGESERRATITADNATWSGRFDELEAALMVIDADSVVER